MYSEAYESPPNRSNTIVFISIILTILSVVGSFAVAYIIGHNTIDGRILSGGLIYTVIQAFIMYCIYTHIEYQEQQIKLLKDIRQSLNKDKEN